MVRRLALLALLVLPLIAWLAGLDALVSSAKRGALYKLHAAETFAAYPNVVLYERLGNLRRTLHELSRSSDPISASRGDGVKRRGDGAPQPDLSSGEVLDMLDDGALSSVWLRLSPEQRWSLYTSPRLRTVRLGTRLVGGGLAITLLLALIRGVGRGMLSLLLAPAMILWSYRRLSPGDSHGTARWAASSSLRELAPKRSEPPLVFGVAKLGRLGREQLVGVPEKQQYEHVYLAAPPGAGKTSGVITPNLLTEPGTRSIVATDPKGELLPLTYTQLAKTYGRERVLVVDFADPWISKRYNPLAFVHDATTATLFADTLVQNTGVSQKDPFWGNINRQIIAAVALDLVRSEDNPPLAALANILAGTPPDEIRRRLLQSPAPEARRVAASQLDAIQKNEKLMGAVFTEIAGRFEFLLDGKIRAVTGSNDIDFAKLGREPMVLYLSLHLDRNEFYKPLTACFFANLFGQLTDAAKATRTKTLPVKVMCYMDEFGVMGRIPNFQERLATIRGYGIGCLMVAQSKSQLHALYGEDAAKSILQNANTKMCLSRVTGEDARMFSDLSGMATVLSSNQTGTRPTAHLLRSSAGIGRSETQRALITPDELRTMGDDVFAVLAGEHSIRVRQRPYYKDARLSRLIPDLEKTDVLATLRRSYPLPDPGLGTEIPDQLAVEGAIATELAEGEYVRMGGVSASYPIRPSGKWCREGSSVRVRDPAATVDRRATAAPVTVPIERNPAATVVATPAHKTVQPNGAALLNANHIRVLELLAEDRGINQVAAELGFKPQSVRNMLTTIYSRLGVQTRGEQGRLDAVQIARERGVIPKDVSRDDERGH